MKRNLQIELSDRHLLRDVAAQVHLDLVHPLIVKGQVGEGGQVEAGLEFAIQALQQVEVKGRGDAGGVVIGRLKNVYRLSQIKAEQQVIAGLQGRRQVSPEVKLPRSLPRNSTNRTCELGSAASPLR